MDHQPHVVFMNLAQCWGCGRTIPPTEEVRRRRMRTGDAYHFGLFCHKEEQYGPVTLCVSCDDLVAIEERTGQIQRTQAFFFWAGALILFPALCVLGVPWWLAAGLVVVFAYYGVLWWIIAAWGGIAAALQSQSIPIENNLTQIVPVFLIAAVIVCVAKWIEVRRRHNRPIAPQGPWRRAARRMK